VGLLDCIDIRSGEAVKSIRRDGFPTYFGYRTQFDANAKTAVIDTQSDSLKLRFTSPCAHRSSGSRPNRESSAGLQVSVLVRPPHESVR
jgi:hypothetical protein